MVNGAKRRRNGLMSALSHEPNSSWKQTRASARGLAKRSLLVLKKNDTDLISIEPSQFRASASKVYHSTFSAAARGLTLSSHPRPEKRTRHLSPAGKA